MKKILQRVEADAKGALGFLGAVKRALTCDCIKCGDTGILPTGLYCDCREGALRIELDVKKHEPEKPAIETSERKRLPR
jgi:hypothetical protein